MKKIFLILLATFCCNELNASVINTDMSTFKTNGSTADGGKSRVWFMTLNYKNVLWSTKNGSKTKVLNRIAQTTVSKIHELFPKLEKSNELDIAIHNAIIKFLKTRSILGNRKAIYIHEPINNGFAEPIECPNKITSTKDYTIIPVTIDNSPAYLEIIGFRKGIYRHLKIGTKYDDSNIRIKVTKPSSGADASTDIESEESDE